MIIEAPISMRSNTRIRRFINNTLIPQMMFWGLKDGMSEEEIGKFDKWDIEDLI